VIRFERVGVTYAGEDRPVLRDVSLVVPEGELCLLAGATGSGKSTLLRAVNGLVPHFTGGTLSGRVTVAGRDTRTHPPRELADVVGVVGQDPLHGFVTDTVEEELAYAMEQLAVPPATMRKRVEETLDLLGIADLRDRPLRTLSGGQQQRVAIGSVLTAHPRVLVLDEPTSALDPTAAEEVIAAVTRLVHDLGVTVLMAEHRLERVVPYADRMLLLPGDGTLVDGPPAAVLARAPVAPPVVELGRLAGWDPLPLSVRDARRLAGPLRDRLAERPVPTPSATVPGDVLLDARGVVVRYGKLVAVAGVDLTLRAGEVVALMGRNGSGKSSLLWALQGAGPRASGSVRAGGAGPAGSVRATDANPASSVRAGGADPVGSVRATGADPASSVRAGGADPVGSVRATDANPASSVRAGGADPVGSVRATGADPASSVRATGADPAVVGAARARKLVGLVPQTPGDLLYLETVAAECRAADRESGRPPGTCAALLAELADLDPRTHPRDLSEGQRLALVLAVQLTAAPPVLLLDEPTRGLDYGAKRRFAAIVRGLAAEGRAVVVATHDVELVAALADRVVVMAQGEVVADGPTAAVVVASPAFAPQVAKILAPEPWLTVDAVAAALR